MTTITYRDGIMAADSRAYAGFNTPLGVKQKIRRCHGGTLIGVSSNQVGLSGLVLDWYEAGARETPTWDNPKFTLLAVIPDGRAFYAYDRFHLTGPIEAPFFAIGSGEANALGALHMGASAERAVEVAIVCDVWSGPPVFTLRHEE